MGSEAWSADGFRALSGARDGIVRLWDVESGRCLRVLEGHTGAVWCVAWSADGRRAFSGDDKGGIRVWDLSAFVAEAVVYMRGPGRVVRCRTCGECLIVLVTIRGITCVDMSGIAELHAEI